MKLRRVGLVALVCVVVLLALEGLTRALALAPPLPARFGEYEAHEVLPFRMRPNTVRRERLAGDSGFEFEVRTNSLGFRDTEHSFDKAEGVFRILGIGDSFTMGAGAVAGDTYLAILERMIDATGTSVEIIKAGQPRYWPEPERVLLELYGERFRPDLILVGFTPNDVTDTYIGASYLGVRDGYLVSREGYELGRAGVGLYVRSHVARILLRAYLDRLASRGRGVVAEVKIGEVFQDDGFHEADWRSVEGEFERMVEIARGLGAEIAFLHIPFRVPKPRYAYAGERLKRWGESHGVTVIDAFPAMAYASERQELYWKKDIHCNAAGYRVLATVAYSGLSAAGLLPDPPPGF